MVRLYQKQGYPCFRWFSQGGFANEGLLVERLPLLTRKALMETATVAAKDLGHTPRMV